MAYTIALAGKGGSGKTTIAGLIVSLLREKGAGSILAVDADPNSNLAETLGVSSETNIGTLIDEVASYPEKIPAGMTKDRFIEYQVQTAIAEGEGFDVLTMGRPEGPGCYCYANNVLRGSVGKLLNEYDYVIIDNEAGLEHLSRRTTRSADVLLVVSQPTAAGLRAAQRISALASELKIRIGKKQLLFNCAADEEIGNYLRHACETQHTSCPRKRASILEQTSLIMDPRFRGDDGQIELSSGFPCIGALPRDERIEELSIKGHSIFELGLQGDALSALRNLGGTIWG